MLASIEGIRVAGMRVAVPETRHSFLDDHGPFTADEVTKITESIGVRERRILPRHLCASDMCLAAAMQLLADLDWSPDSVDMLIFISQDPDYTLPATACLLQRALGLPTHAAAFDINLGCSGFIYGIWVASQLLQGSDGRRALMLNGDTSSRSVMPDDRATSPLFGDAGAATALERTEKDRLYATLGTDGRGASHIAVKAGGKRNSLVPTLSTRSTEETAQLLKDAHLTMNGAEVFGFTLRVVPGLIREALANADISADNIDYFIMHQANRFILEHLRKKSGIPEERFLIDMAEFGNTSSASIPLAIVHSLGKRLVKQQLTLMLCGFGVGWSWGTLLAKLGPWPATGLIEVPNDYPPLRL